MRTAIHLPTSRREKINENEPREYLPLVGDLMSRDVFTLTKEDSLKTLGDVMEWKIIRHVPVVDEEEHVVGLVTHRDFLKVTVSGLARMTKGETDALYSRIRIADIMGRKVATISPEASLQQAAEVMLKHKYGCLPVVDENGKLIGILTESDFMNAFLKWEVQFFRGNA